MDQDAALNVPTQAALQLRAHFERAGLRVEGVCDHLSDLGEHWRHTAALLAQDGWPVTMADADTMGQPAPENAAARASGACVGQVA